MVKKIVKTLKLAKEERKKDLNLEFIKFQLVNM